MVLRKHQCPPGLIHLLHIISPVTPVHICIDGSHGPELFRPYDIVLRTAHLSADFLHDLRTPHKAHKHILLRKMPVLLGLLGLSVQNMSEIFLPGSIYGIIFCRIPYPRAESPACILIAHAHRISESRLPAGIEIFSTVVIRHCLPDSPRDQIFASVPRNCRY